MDKNITDHVLKLSGKAHLFEGLDLSHNYSLKVEGSVIEVTDSDNQDGTYARYYKYKPVLVTVLGDKGEMIKTRDLRRRSEQLRATIWKEWKNSDVAVEFDNYYDQEMLKLIQQRSIY